MITTSHSMDNYPGLPEISGIDFSNKIFDHLKKYEEAEIIEDEVISILKVDEIFLMSTKNQKNIKAKTIIISTGTDKRKANIKGEEEFLGKGISYCTTCDAFFFKDKEVAIVVENNCDIDPVLILSDIAKKVYFICLEKKLECDANQSKTLEERKNIEFFYNSKPIKISGKEKVEKLEIQNEEKNKKLKVDGVFIEIGSTPLDEITKNLGVKMDDQKFIEVDANMQTSVEGIYAAGDITNQKLKQVIVASAQGAIASKSAYSWINKE